MILFTATFAMLVATDMVWDILKARRKWINKRHAAEDILIQQDVDAHRYVRDLEEEVIIIRGMKSEVFTRREREVSRSGSCTW